MNACGPRCGWCGACDDGVRESPSQSYSARCEHCGQTIVHVLTLAGVGMACSRTCMDALEAKFAAVVGGRRG